MAGLPTLACPPPVPMAGLSPPSLSRQHQWRYAFFSPSQPCPVSNNDDTHVNNRPPLQFVLKQTIFSKLFLKQAP